MNARNRIILNNFEAKTTSPQLKTLAVLFSVVIFSWTNAMGQFSLGIQGGSNLSKMDFTNNPDYRFTEINYFQGLIGGIVFQYLGEKHAGVQFEFNFSQRGWVENDTIGMNNLKYKNHMQYLELPILTHINIGGGKFRGLLNLGPYLAYALNRSITKTDVNTASDESINYTFDKESDNRLDFGLLVGGGFEYRSSIGKFAVEARYTIGLGDIDKEKNVQSEVSQFRILAILLRYTLPLGQAKSDPE